MRTRVLIAVGVLWASGCGTIRPEAEATQSGVHPAGILDPNNPQEFHGALLAATGWNFNACTVCHGGDFAGGQSGVSCLTCHPGGPVCASCHGGAAGAAPPTDLSGNTAISAIGVGTHQSHLQAPHRLRGPILCQDCHIVPATVGSPGHLDNTGPAPVFPADPNFMSLGQAAGAIPQWNRTSGRCTNVYCHGGGATLAQDESANLLRDPLWTQPGQAACGTCHGVPPSDFYHVPTLRLFDCVTCHPATMDATGALIVTGPPGAETSAHINGVVDVVP
jgi:predicted CxxxxCH...CXXCH cytochrome family protein